MESLIIPITDLQNDFDQGKLINLPNISKVTRQLSSIQDTDNFFQNQDEMDLFVKSLINYLSKPVFYQQDSDIQESVCRLFNVLLENYTFEAFTTRIHSLTEIINAIEVTNNSVILSSLGALILKASPIDILANTELVKVLLNKLNSQDVSISIVNWVEKLILNIKTGDLIRRRLVSKEIISILNKMKRDENLEINVRLFDLLKLVYLEFINVDDLPISLFKFTKRDLQNDDVMYPISIINFYNSILDIIITRDLKWLVEELDFDIIVELMYDDEYLYKNLVINEILIMLGKLSYCEFFSGIDSKFQIIDKIVEDYHYDENSNYLISLLNPKIFIKHDLFLSNLKLSFKTMSIYMNFISMEKIFNKISISTSDLQKLPSLQEIFIILDKMSQYHWSSIYLLNSLPVIMNLLLDSPILNPDLIELKKQILTNLLIYNDEDLNIWYFKIKQELNKLLNGVEQTPQVTVHDNTS